MKVVIEIPWDIKAKIDGKVHLDMFESTIVIDAVKNGEVIEESNDTTRNDSRLPTLS